MQSDRYKLARKVDLEVEHMDASDAPMSPGELLCKIPVASFCFLFWSVLDVWLV